MSWAMPHLLPAEKWIPSYTPPFYWQVRDASCPVQLAPLPEGEIAPWWLYPKDQWTYQPVPWEPKVFGAFSARKVMMAENLPINIDPITRQRRVPPFGYVKLKTAPDYSPSGDGRAPSVNTIKVHMRPKPWLDITPHPSLWAEEKLQATLQEMTRKRPLKLVTEDGTITLKAIRSANWYQHENKIKERRAQMKAERQEKAKELIAAEVIKTKGMPKPTTDLFA